MSLTKEEYEKSLHIISESASKTCHNVECKNCSYFIKNINLTVECKMQKYVENIYQLINEHFDNPPLKFEDLHEDMWVWDNRLNAYFLIKAIKPQSHWNIVIYANYLTDTFEKIYFEKNRFYRYEVKANE